MEIFDTAGHERFHTLTAHYVRGAGGALLAFDLTKQKTFDNVRFWYTYLQRNAPDALIVLIGTKCDLSAEITVTRAQAEEYAKSINVPYFECSAKDGRNVGKVFDHLTCQVFSNVAKLPSAAPPPPPAVPPTSTTSTGSVCDF
ncbi:rab family small GTPase [Pelomyxa schiedti]|nr:rab family small GTPase [Pelomyxa schiedti]